MAQQHELEATKESEEFLGGVLSGRSEALGERAGRLAFENELDTEYEDEFEAELEAEDELEGEFEAEFEDELETLFGEPGNDYEVESAYELEADYEDESEDFVKGIGAGLRRAARFARRGSRVLRPLAKVAAPLVGTAVGGPLGGLAGSAVAALLESEDEHDAESEVVAEGMTREQAHAEALAAQAALSESAAEAEALVGAAASTVLNRPDRAVLRSVHADLVRGAAALAELLHRNKATRPYAGVVPAIIDRTAHTLTRSAAQGRRVTRGAAAKAMATHTARVLGNPRITQRALARHVRGVSSAGRVADHPGQVRAPALRGLPLEGKRQRPRQESTVRVVTPIRVPGKNGKPAKLVRIVTDVRVPRGGVPAARTAVVRKTGR
jgi:hypothetical protein